MQVMPETDAGMTPYNPFDLTKIRPHKHYRLIEVGERVLNRHPENRFAEIGHFAFAPSNGVPGIGFSPDRMLQGRIFAYADAQRYRIGASYKQPPVNAPECPCHNNQRDGAMRFDGNFGARQNHEPSHFDATHNDAAHKEAPQFAEPPLQLDGAAARWDHRVDEDYYSNAGALFRPMAPAQKQMPTDNLAGAMTGVPRFIQEHQVD